MKSSFLNAFNKNSESGQYFRKFITDRNLIDLIDSVNNDEIDDGDEILRIEKTVAIKLGRPALYQQIMNHINSSNDKEKIITENNIVGPEIVKPEIVKPEAIEPEAIGAIVDNSEPEHNHKSENDDEPKENLDKNLDITDNAESDQPEKSKKKPTASKKKTKPATSKADAQ